MPLNLQSLCSARVLCLPHFRTVLFVVFVLGAMLPGLHSAYAQTDVTQPGNTIVPTSTASPSNEPASNAIDNNVSTKYLNFDELNTGFSVVPSVGSTVVTGIRLTTANDAPDRDPVSYELYGSNNYNSGTNTGTFTLIASGGTGLGTDPGRLSQGPALTFTHTTAYTAYRVIFPMVRNATTANSMQVAEVELLGSPVSQPGSTFSVTNTNDSGAGSLRQAIINANANSATADTIIFLLPAGPQTINLTSGQLAISGHVTITGPGASLLSVRRDPAGSTPDFRILNTTLGTVNISGLTISGGKVVGTTGANSLSPGGDISGGGILNTTTLNLSNCVLSNNIATGGTGFSGANNAFISGTAGGAGRGGGIDNSGALTLTNCYLTGNQANGGTGGKGSDVTYSSAGTAAIGGIGGLAQGGGIFSSGGSLSISNSTLANNISYGGTGGNPGFNDNAGRATPNGVRGGHSQGGAIYNDGSPSLTQVTLSGNVANGGVGGQGGFNTSSSSSTGGPGGDGYGAGIFNVSGSPVLTNCTVTENEANGGNGGAGGGPDGSPGLGDGGGIFNLSGNFVTVGSSIIAGNVVLLSAPSGATAPDFIGFFNSAGYNLIGIQNTGPFSSANNDQVGSSDSPLEPRLAPLRNTGGAVPTRALRVSSPAIDKGKSSLANDARGAGFSRRVDQPAIAAATGGDNSDIGAFEEQDTFQIGNTLTVNKLADTGDGVCGTNDCSLRDAVETANALTGNPTINFAVTGTISLNSALPNLNDMFINGPSAKTLKVERAAGAPDFVVFTVSPSYTVTLSGLTVSGATGNSSGILNRGILTINVCTISGNASFGMAGGIANYGTLSVNRSEISGNSAGFGGGIGSFGTATITNSTIAGNATVNSGGGIYSQGTINIHNSTIASNTANNGGGVYNNYGTANASSSLIAANDAAMNPDVFGTFTSNGYNLIGKSDGSTGFTNNTNNDRVGTAATPLDAKLELDNTGKPLLKDNGGTTATIALLAGSPAIDNGNANSLTTDQRGLARQTDGDGNGSVVADIGAFEKEAATPPGVSISGRIVDAQGVGIINVSISRGAGSTPVTTDGSGNYTFTGVPAGSYTLTPTKSGYAFSPATRNVTTGAVNITGQNFTGYNATLNGRVAFSNGTGIGNVQVRLNIGRNVLTNSAGYYSFTAMVPGAYTVTPVLSGYSFDPAYRSVTIGATSVSNINFTGGFTINGRLSTSTGTGLANLRVYRTGSAVPAVTNSAGYYSFYGVTNGTYTITPDATQGYGYTPQSRSVTVNGASVGGQNFIGASGFNITGRISSSNGSGIEGVSVTRSGSATAATTNGAGYYTFYGVANGTYTLTPSKGGYNFTPATKSVTVNGANVASQNFTGSGP